MRSRTADWFETKIRYEKTMEDGLQKKVTEVYVVDALSFTEAESTITEEIKKASYKEIFFSEADADDRWYKAKLQFITIDEKTDKEKRSNVYYLVQAKSLPVAVKHIEEVMGTTLIDYVIASLAETQIMDVFEHQAAAAKPQSDVPEQE